MNKHPLINALLAALYISFVGLIPTLAGKIPEPKDTFLGPIVFISVFTLSAAIMAYLFFYQPVYLLIEHKKSEALKFLLQTIGYFALITVVATIVLIMKNLM